MRVISGRSWVATMVGMTPGPLRHLPSLNWTQSQARPQGAWTALALSDSAAWAALQTALQQAPSGGLKSWSLQELTQLDHLGAQVLFNAWGGQWPTELQASPAQLAVLRRVAALQTSRADMADLAAQENADASDSIFKESAYIAPADASPESAPHTLLTRLLARVPGLWNAWEHARDFVQLTGQLALDTGAWITGRQRIPWGEISAQVYRVGTTALPITALVGGLIGVVLAYLSAKQLAQFGANVYIVNLLGIALIRELGPVLAAILLAGRCGSAITAQIGVMRVTQELDAMRVLGLSRGARLVLPRVLALSVAMPLLSVWTTLCAMGGGMVVSNALLDISPAYFIVALPQAVDAVHLGLASAKSLVFGAVVALLACHFGLRVKPNTQSLGAMTTASVVSSITAVILIDALFAVLFMNLGF